MSELLPDHYKYSGLHFMPEMIKDLLELIDPERVYKRSLLIDVIYGEHINLGGLQYQGKSVATAFKKILARFVQQGILEQPIAGHYRLKAVANVKPRAKALEVPNTEMSHKKNDNLPLFSGLVSNGQKTTNTADKSGLLNYWRSFKAEIGEGNHHVYVVVDYRDIKLAEIEAKPRWPHKVGMSEGVPGARISDHRSPISTEPPITVLIWKTDYPKLHERITHLSLELAMAKRGEGLLGKEVFVTDPVEILETIFRIEPQLRDEELLAEAREAWPWLPVS